MNYSELSDAQISQMVGAMISRDQQSVIGVNGKAFIHHYGAPFGDYVSLCLGWVEFDPCNSWADAGPIILASKLWLREMFGTWQARGFPEKPHSHNQVGWSDDNPLRAAMIVFLMMREDKCSN